jgi:CheY-like chemotaxis protein
LRVVGDRGNRTVAITVWDKGIGIAPADIPRLFKPFVQLDSRLAREHAGTGLGLAIVAQIARGLGGEVSVDSRPGEGSRFVVTLPWDPDRTLAPRSEDDVATEEKSTGPADRRRTILMIEDTEVVAKVTKDYLQAAGYRILQASDGVAGITMARESRPDLILMDVQLPGLDGVEAARRIHEDPVMRKVPIVALTALAMPGDRERCLEAGMAEYVSKPVGLRQLGEIVKRNLA